MAKSKNNVVTHGLSGKIGDLLVFRRWNGQTIVGKIPEKNKNVSAKQAEQRKRFQQAIIYAKIAAETPETGELYREAAKKQKGKNPVSIAVADFFNAPDIDKVDMSGYDGSAGGEIRIYASDDFAVKAVKVCIHNAAGMLVEEGDAVQGVATMWTYVATQNNETPDGSRIAIEASDFPGNVTVDEVTV